MKINRGPSSWAKREHKNKMFQLDLMVAVGMACPECLFVSDVPCCSLVLFIFFFACVLVLFALAFCLLIFLRLLKFSSPWDGECANMQRVLGWLWFVGYYVHSTGHCNAQSASQPASEPNKQTKMTSTTLYKILTSRILVGWLQSWGKCDMHSPTCSSTIIPTNIAMIIIVVVVIQSKGHL